MTAGMAQAANLLWEGRQPRLPVLRGQSKEQSRLAPLPQDGRARQRNQPETPR